MNIGGGEGTMKRKKNLGGFGDRHKSAEMPSLGLSVLFEFNKKKLF
jgi:hypothetical protein